MVIATVNEDANSSLYTIGPAAPAGSGVQHFTHNRPLPHNGGTDAITIYQGQIFVSASAPGTVDVVTGGFADNSIFVAVTPCDAANAPATCPAPGFPPNYLGVLSPRTGHVGRVMLTGRPRLEPKGMLFLSSEH